jgi:hypothetical protein
VTARLKKQSRKRVITTCGESAVARGAGGGVEGAALEAGTRGF